MITDHACILTSQSPPSPPSPSLLHSLPPSFTPSLPPSLPPSSFIHSQHFSKTLAGNIRPHSAFADSATQTGLPDTAAPKPRPLVTVDAGAGVQALAVPAWQHWQAPQDRAPQAGRRWCGGCGHARPRGGARGVATGRWVQVGAVHTAGTGRGSVELLWGT